MRHFAIIFYDAKTIALFGHVNKLPMIITVYFLASVAEVLFGETENSLLSVISGYLNKPEVSNLTFF